MRLVKSPGELALMQHAIDVSVDAHLEAMKMMRPGLYEYQIAVRRMVEIHDWGGCETEAYALIVGSGPNSVVLHYDKLSRKIEGGDIVLLDVGGQYSGYASDITRTLPANGHFTPRQREIYDIVLGAQNAAFAAAKPGMTLGHGEAKSLYAIAYNYINTHGKDREGRSLGRYFIHGPRRPVGLEVHDNGDNDVAEQLMYSTLQPGMVITLEPGIYIPEENIGVRIEDDVPNHPDRLENADRAPPPRSRRHRKNHGPESRRTGEVFSLGWCSGLSLSALVTDLEAWSQRRRFSRRPVFPLRVRDYFCFSNREHNLSKIANGRVHSRTELVTR